MCCVALAFTRSADFPIDKDVGEPCQNLRPDHRCGIHPELRERGFVGCTVYDCFGAGQKISRATFAGQDWREHPEVRSAMFALLPVLRHVHELLWYLTEAISLVDGHDAPSSPSSAWPWAGSSASRSAHPTSSSPRTSRRCATASILLLRASEAARARSRHQPEGGGRTAGGGSDRQAARSRRPARASLRGALLLGADLRGRTCAAPTWWVPTCAVRTCAAPTSRTPSSSPRPR
ncbi:pentapeptide repeat-containing protein [Oerskovia sp. M15]